MTDHQTPSELLSAKKLKPSQPANDDMNPDTANEENILNNNTQPGPGIENVIHPNSFCSAEESVFSIDHLLEFIMDELDRKTLLNCRLVSRRWVHFSSKFLPQIVTFKLRNDSNQQELYCTGNQNRSFKDLITLMNYSTDRNFPCASFEFENFYARGTDSLAQRFFTAHGHFIKKLTFSNYLLVSDLRRLLLFQAPNLEELHCYSVTWTYTKSESRLNKSETEEERRRRTESLFSETVVGLIVRPIFKNLKTFVCRWKGIPTKFLLQLLECSPNLVEVILEPQYLQYLVRPVNRLHLLKTLSVRFAAENIDELEVVANNHGGNWAVDLIWLYADSEYSDQHMVSQVKEVARKFLKGCAATCQWLEWDHVFEDFQFPVMTGVKHFRLIYTNIDRTEIIFSNFPEIERLGDTFPNLTSLEVENNSKVFLTNENVFRYKGGAPVTTVKNVSFNFRPDLILMESFRKMFPNAVINN